ncbi:DUF4199 domain-containing protein [Demequina activiva]|uniref:DUF4190 domain-containing protein n=1 Tax=Demequina activiva TaxID=1582364 RepID=A0A919UGD8_9MICO|nr:DUF4199 domain-containing protein [Demequina activiva]GIG54732.1 hypothetical protein Dac01nite_14840 [Demequina activiva]
MAEPEERVSPIPAPARRDSQIFLVMLGVTSLLYLLSVPWAFAMILTGPVGAFFGARALYRSRSAPGITVFRVSLGFGILMSLFSVLMAITFAVFSDAVSELRDCNGRAVTQQARAQCEAQYEESVADTVDDVLGRFGVSAP